jgi:immune inhibitor A
MNRRILAVTLTVMTVAALMATTPATGRPTEERGRALGHEKVQPKFVQNWMAERIAAADKVARGRAKVRADGVVRLANGQFVDYELERTDHIVTILAEFTDPRAGELPEPDRSADNSTYWVPTMDRRHYRDMLFAPGGGSYGHVSMRDFYLELSSGRYTVDGQVSRWISIDAPGSEFGANGPDGDGSDNLNGPVYRVIDAALQATATQREGIDWSPSVVDVYDRYDCDGDGNFDEPDGYVDHFQLVHAGAGEEAGGGAQGGDAIWSHRWYAGQEGIGTEGPAGCKLGGYQVPGKRVWVGDYTVEPEDGAVSVFAHEFGHDLGLPDFYEGIGGNDNSAEFWTLMASSWPSIAPDAIGVSPYHMSAWEKFALGWLDLEVVEPGDSDTYRIGPAEGASSSGAQALRISLPNYTLTETVFPTDGGDAFYYYSGRGDNLDSWMTRSLGAALGADTELTFRTNYDIEVDWDYAYVLASSDGGANWEPVETSLSTTTNPNGQNFGFGITGTSGAWVDGSATIPAGATDIAFRYWTDGAVVQQGFAVDSIALGGEPVDDASDPSAWDFAGFSQVENGEVTNEYFHYYVVESRSYVRSDENLCGAYQFLYGNWLEKYCNADGLVVWYRNSRFTDNNVSQHPGGGMLLVVDSHPTAVQKPKGNTFWRDRIQAWDAAFGLDDHAITLHQVKGNGGKMFAFDWRATAVSVFDDAVEGAYYDPRMPYSSVITPGSGVRMEITDVSRNRTTYEVEVTNPGA